METKEGEQAAKSHETVQQYREQCLASMGAMGRFGGASWLSLLRNGIVARQLNAPSIRLPRAQPS